MNPESYHRSTEQLCDLKPRSKVAAFASHAKEPLKLPQQSKAHLHEVGAVFILDFRADAG